MSLLIHSLNLGDKFRGNTFAPSSKVNLPFMPTKYKRAYRIDNACVPARSLGVEAVISLNFRCAGDT